jgi:23S rRNA pseudouridine1911/1915/1917 synthase
MVPDVLYEDNHLLVINKQAGWVTQGATDDQDSVVQQCKGYLAEKYAKPGNVFLGVVSRLDQNVTGVLPLARTSKGAARLNEQFRDHTVKKIYWAMVVGDLRESGRLEHWLVRGPQATRSVAHRSPRPDAYHALLQYRCVASQGRHHLLEVTLETGGKHQIRAQLAAVGCPVMGDAKYGSADSISSGIALHCRRIGLRHPTRAVWYDFEAALPKAWRGLGNASSLIPQQAWISRATESKLQEADDAERKDDGALGEAEL